MVNGHTWNQAIMYHLGNSYIKWFFYTTLSLSDYLAPNNECLIFANFLIRCFHIVPKYSHFQLRRHCLLHFNHVKVPASSRVPPFSLALRYRSNVPLGKLVVTSLLIQANSESKTAGGRTDSDGEFLWQASPWSLVLLNPSQTFLCSLLPLLKLICCSLCGVASVWRSSPNTQGQKAKDAVLHCKIINI